MSYNHLPIGTQLSPSQFMTEINRALRSLPNYEHGMVICADESGYWLEVNGERQTGNEDLVALSRNLVLSAKS